MDTSYLPRIADNLLNASLDRIGAVLIRGAKWCGKTRTASQRAGSTLFMQDPDKANAYLDVAQIQPSRLLQGETPRLIDEWQVAPVLWDAVVFEVNKRSAYGQFILTGSSVPKDDGVMHTGTGRIGRITMRPMTLFESGESAGEVSLSRLFAGAEDIDGTSNLSIDDIAFLIARGGWPQAVLQNDEAALGLAYDYVEAIVESDISRIDDVKRNPDHARALLRSLARSSAQQTTLKTIREDMQSDGSSVTENTQASYLNALRRLFVVEDLKAWSPKMRSKTALRAAPTWHFTDPSIAVAALGASPSRLLDDLETMGFLFESLCVRDLRTYADFLGGEVLHFRDRTGLEADAIVQLRDGRWGAVEVKLGGAKNIEEGCAHLIDLENRIDTSIVLPPVFKMILTGGQMAYRRKDGVYVVPLGCLCP